MFFDKLWVRIRGELLALQEDNSVTDDLKAKAGRLLDRVQERVTRGEDAGQYNTRDREGAHTRHDEAPERKRKDLAALEEQWRKIAEERDRQKDSYEDHKPLPPNPRELG
jgi:hypothetical protein